MNTGPLITEMYLQAAMIRLSSRKAMMGLLTFPLVEHDGRQRAVPPRSIEGRFGCLCLTDTYSQLQNEHLEKPQPFFHTSAPLERNTVHGR
jgi:hypothetical protein